MTRGGKRKGAGRKPGPPMLKIVYFGNLDKMRRTKMDMDKLKAKIIKIKTDNPHATKQNVIDCLRMVYNLDPTLEDYQDALTEIAEDFPQAKPKPFNSVEEFAGMISRMTCHELLDIYSKFCDVPDKRCKYEQAIRAEIVGRTN